MRLRRLVAACLLPGIGAIAATEPAPEAIADARAQASARFAEQERDCQRRFRVSACLAAARKTRDAELERLRREEIELDDAKRRAAGAARTRALNAKAEAQAARAGGPAAPDAERPARPARALPPTAAGSASDLAGPIAPLHRGRHDAAQRRADERRNEEKFESRARAAQAHRAEVERRNAERAARGKVAAPLPLPPGASAAK